MNIGLSLNLLIISLYSIPGILQYLVLLYIRMMGKNTHTLYIYIHTYIYISKFTVQIRGDLEIPELRAVESIFQSSYTRFGR